MADFKKNGSGGGKPKFGGRPPVAKHFNPYGGKPKTPTQPRNTRPKSPVAPREEQPPRETRDEREFDDDDDGGGVIEGRNAVLEAIRAGVPLDKVYIAKGETDASLAHIASNARNAGAVVVDADRRKLDALSRTHAHQGVVALTAAAAYVEVADILAIARERGEEPLIVVCDGISDPHNLGAIIRTAEAAGAHGVVIPKRRSAGITAIVAKTSAGAAFHLPVARVANLTAALQELKEQGVWIYGTAPLAETVLWETDLRGAAAIVVGSEGEGMGRLVSETCDFQVKIPMAGKISSLNASVSAALIIYEAVRQRGTR
ncbi:MAG: 23S rRNA (guanosine(2251)-2'-O)-methyltransferase RlmB [Oscillospiraceae bacterium]|jgi:23S rRNA (guanosine2251-2'-O)-methyltransferase|nr:23S rRNA (guanosine(2251)-2'-O)-methyltransferase RlmB [Oscillospiraceae bacterium]